MYVTVHVYPCTAQGYASCVPSFDVHKGCQPSLPADNPSNKVLDFSEHACKSAEVKWHTPAEQLASLFCDINALQAAYRCTAGNAVKAAGA